MRYLYVLPLAIFFGLLIQSCDSAPTEVAHYNPEPIVTAYLSAGDTLKAVYLERVSPLKEFYTPRGIPGSEVKIYEVGAAGAYVDSFFFEADPSNDWICKPVDKYLIPKNMTRYRLKVRTPAPHNEFLYAETFVPAPIDQNGNVEIFIPYEDGSRMTIPSIPFISDTTDTTGIPVLNRSMPNMAWTWHDVDSSYGFQGVLLALTQRDSLEMLDPEWGSSEADTLEDYQRHRHGYDIYRYDQRRTDIYWIAFQWTGFHRVELRALSSSLNDYLFSMFRFQQGLIEGPTSNIYGGLGIFGAYSRYTTHIYMRKVE